MRGRIWLAAIAAALLAPAVEAAPQCPWRAGWTASQMRAEGDNALPAGSLADATLRQVLRPSIGGDRLRVRLSNAFGTGPLRIDAVTLARSADNASARIVPGSARALTFGGSAAVTIPAGADWLSDPIDWPLKAFDDLTLSLHVPEQPAVQTSHPGSRATSYVVAGNAADAVDLPGAKRVDHWYLLSGVEVAACGTRAGIVALGDSITDGNSTTTNGNNRWTDVFARRLGGRVAVLNQGIGGNRILADGLGPSAMARLDRDVLAQPGVGHVIVLIGVNDLGGLARTGAATAEQHRVLVDRITGAYAQIVARARARGLKVHGATILPFRGSGYYHPDDATEADRQAINRWIRTPGHFDGVIDWDRIMRDPARPDHLNPAFDSGDGLHPGPAGYRAMGEAVPLAPFR